MPMDDEFRNARRIDTVELVGLFGHLDYLLKMPKSDIAILYGDNGTGKTTILNLVYHTLSPEDSRGHRTVLATTPFKRFVISFTDGSKIEVKRRNAEVGPFSMLVVLSNGEIARHNFTVVEGAVKTQEPISYELLLNCLRQVSIGLLFLPDTRRIESNLWEDNEEDHRWLKKSDAENFRRPELDKFVEGAASRALNWVRRSTLTASNRGENDTSKIYFEIVKRLVNRTSKEADSMDFDQLSPKLSELKTRSDKFAKFGITPTFELDDITDILAKANNDQKAGVVEVITPYLKTFGARLDALEEVRSALETFERIFNEFYNHKNLTFDLRRGLRITQHYSETALEPRSLSSGEKQLLLLFCNVMLARSQPSLFIIDEPELSLNVKWQRNLVDELRACVKGCNVQFIMATHSLEMITSSKSSTLKLQPLTE